jgi:hypothetical protein
MALYLGAVLGGPELIDKEFDRVVSLICKNKDQWQSALIEPTDGSLNVVFQYPGSVSQPTFAGIKVGRFISKEARLQILVAVPRDVMSSKEFPQHYAALLTEALTQAKRVFDQKGVPFSLQAHLALVEKSLEGLT